MYRSFQLPDGSHDVDSLGDDRYAWVNGTGDRAVVWDYSTGETVWQYNFSDHYPPSAGNGPPDSYEGDYTHLNDIDPVDNATKFLLSPRNFDRVVLVDRATKETEWTLGEEDNYSILYEQHNPDLIQTDPPTVLVADSENDRAVEYRRQPDGEWDLVWEYSGDLVWPRDADRLDNGNTLIVDSRKAIEVTPDREIVWGVRVPKYLYDSERIGEGDSQRGPSMVEYRDQFDSARDAAPDRGPVAALVAGFEGIYNTAGWVLPWWLGKGAFALLLPAAALLFAWGNVELRDAVVRRTRGTRLRDRSIPYVGPLLTGATLLAGVAVLAISTLSGIRIGDSLTDVTVAWWFWDPAYHAVGLLLLLEGTARLRDVFQSPWDTRAEYARVALVAVTLVFALGLAFLVGVYRGAHRISNPQRLLAFSSVGALALLELVRRPGLLGDVAGLTVGRWRSGLAYAAGLAVALVSIAVLGFGLDATVVPASYVLLAFALLLAGDRTMARASAGAGPTLQTAAVLVRYLLRPAWLALAAGVVLQLLGLGAIAGVGSDLNLLHPLTVGLFVLCVARLLRSAPGTGSDGTATAHADTREQPVD